MPSEAPPLPPDESPLERDIAFQMTSIIFRLDQDLRDTVLRRLDLTHVHFRVLQYLYEKDGQTIGEISQAIVVRQPVLSRVVDQLIERKLVLRRTDATDHRRMRVFLTDEGKSRYLEAWPAVQALIRSGLRGLAPQEEDTLLMLLRKISNTIFK